MNQAVEQNYSPVYQEATAQVTSRLTKHEQNKVAKQTAMIAGVSIVVALVFFFVVIPGLIRFVGAALDGNINTDLADTIPPQKPVLAAPPDATPSAKVLIKGYTEAKAAVYVVANGEKTGEVIANDTGDFEIDVALTAGENTITAYAKDQAGNESELGKQYMIIMDNEVPKLELKDLADGQSFQTRQNQLLTVSGTTEPKARVYLNDRLVFAKADGSFTTKHQLNEGENILKFRILDQAGNQFEKELKVQFKL
jgi:bacillopeptidase F